MLVRRVNQGVEKTKKQAIQWPRKEGMGKNHKGEAGGKQCFPKGGKSQGIGLNGLAFSVRGGGSRNLNLGGPRTEGRKRRGEGRKINAFSSPRGMSKKRGEFSGVRGKGYFQLQGYID